MFSKKESLYITVATILGLFLSWLIIFLLPISYQPILEAKKLGIISLTIINNYPKHMEVYYYLTFLLVTPITAITIWYYIFINNNSKNIPKTILRTKEETKYGYSLSIKGKIIISAVSIYLIYYTSYFTSFWINNWYFFGEQGQNLAWVQGILTGKIAYRDIFVLFGPLMTYPLALMQELFSKSVLTARVFGFLSYCLTAVIIAIIPFSIYKKKMEATIAAFLLLAFYFPIKQCIHATPFRVFIGVFSVYLLFKFYISRSKRLLVLSAIMSAVSFLYTQEIGLTMMVICFLFWISQIIQYRNACKNVLNELVVFIITYIVTLLPFFIYFYANGALIPFLDNIIKHPKNFTLGYAALPSPNLSKKIIELFSGKIEVSEIKYPFAFYFPVLIYLITLTVHTILFIKKELVSRDVFFIMINIFGIIIFRAALGRSDGFHLLQVYAPAIFLVFYLASLSNTKISIFDFEGGILTKTKLSYLLKYTLLFLPLFLIPDFTDNLKEIVKINTIDIVRKFSNSKPKNMEKVNIPELEGIYVPEYTADQINDLISFSKNIKANEEIFVYGNAPLIYFLLNKTNPTAFDMVLYASDNKQQKELIDSLHKSKPEYVIYKKEGLIDLMDSMDYLDGLPHSTHVPIVHKYISQNYFTNQVYHYSGFNVYKRKKIHN